MRCYNRYFDDIYLHTCLEPDGHPGLHKDDNGVTWEDKDGWYDQYGEKERAPEECRPTMTDLMVEPESIEPFPEANPPEPQVDPASLGCFNCRQGAHERCVFGPEFCVCEKKGHQVSEIP